MSGNPEVPAAAADAAQQPLQQAPVQAQPQPQQQPSAQAQDNANANRTDGQDASKQTGEGRTKMMSKKNVIIKANGISYATERVVGNGSFGIVFEANVVGSGEVVAIKKVLQDKRFKNRELQIMKLLNHPNVVQLKNSFYTSGERPDEIFLNLVLEFIPETVYRISRHYNKLRQPVPLLYVKLYMYQLCRALAYIHSQGICHRDIKPQNLLLDPATGVLKLCDFGSAKVLVPGEPNVSYICSRYYRAPELIFGSTTYSTAIDIWSMGCVMAELLLGQPLFPGNSGIDQLVEIIKVLGTPTREQIFIMNQHYKEFRFPQIQGHSWNKVFRHKTPPEVINLIEKMLQYIPASRIKPIDALIHPFFDELRDPNTQYQLGNSSRPLPALFNFTSSELTCAAHIPLESLVPSHIELSPQLIATKRAAEQAYAQTQGQVPPATTGQVQASSSSTAVAPPTANNSVVQPAAPQSQPQQPEAQQPPSQSSQAE